MFNFSLKRECLQIRCTEFIAHVVNAVNIRSYQLIKCFMKYLFQIYFNTVEAAYYDHFGTRAF